MVDKNIQKLAKRIVETTTYDPDTETLFVTNPGISFDVLKGIAKKHNFTIGQTKSGQYVSIPTAFKHTSELTELYDDFMNTYTLFSKNYETLQSVYKNLDAMDENVSEISLILDTYAAEVLSEGFVEDPLNIKINNKAAQEIVERVFYKNRIFQRLPSIVRAIAKYGNYGFLLSYPYLEKWMTEQDVEDFKRIDVLEDLIISFINPKRFKVNTDEYYNVINYEVEDDTSFTKTGTVATSTVSKKIWQPWSFVHAKLMDELTEPYGKSMLWSMRSAFDQLTTLESLLGISRASNIQRLVFYVPLPNGINIIDGYAHMNEWRAQYLNSVFSDTNSPKSGRKLPGAMSILTLPEAADGKKVSIETIEGKIDLAATEDVGYFLDKILRNSSLPKGYLVGEDVITTAQALEAQDLKLKRTLLPLKKALLECIMGLAENVLTHAGYDVSKLDITVSLNEPIQIPADVIDKYSSICDLMKSFIELNKGMTTINKFQFLIKMGLPTEIASLVCSNSSINVLSSAEELGKFLSGQKVRDPNMMMTPDIEESVSLNNKKFNKENYENAKVLKELYNFKNENKNRLLKETFNESKKVFGGKGEYITEDVK